MSTEEQATAYLQEARFTIESAEAIYRAAIESQRRLWAQVVKNGYDAIEQSISAGIAAKDESIPRRHPAKINAFVELYDPPNAIEESLLYWLQRRSTAQYVDRRGGELTVPHQLFDEEDAERILDDARDVLEYVDARV